MDLSALMSRSVEELVRDARSVSLHSAKSLFFFRSFAAASRRAAKLRQKGEAAGTHIPPYLIASITTNCNLFCSGCYARANHSCGEHARQEQLSAERWGELFREAQSMGISFILLAGGEPLMRKDVLNQAARVSGVVFPVFTNGTLIGADYLALFDKRRNLLPVLSLEGGKETTDARRGVGVYDALTQVMAALRKKGVFFGVSVTVTRNNLDEITDESFVQDLADSGCSLVFYVEYVPADNLSYDLAPTDSERLLLESRIRALRAEHSMLFVSFPGDEKETGGCLAAGRGFFHINANGHAEPCPFSPFSDISVADHSLREALNSRLFAKLQSDGFLLGEHTGGCHLFEKRLEVERMLGEG